MNILIFILSALFFLLAVIVVYKYFGKNGLYSYICFATILANIAASKSIELFGLATSAGSVLFASTFLCTDILSEKHGKKASKKSVWLGLLISILWMVGTQVTILFNPSETDFIHESMKTVFGLVPRITIASLVAYIVSQLLDIFMYYFIWNKTGNNKSKMYLRIIGSTLVSQLVDTIIFVTIAFLNVHPFNVFIQILLTTYFFKIVVAFLSTPFAYIARNIETVEE